MKIPCTPKSVFGVVATTPSGPPSNACSWPISTIARLVSFTAPGTTPLADVVIAHVPPIAVEAVATHGVLTGNGMSTTVRVGSATRSHCIEVVRDADLSRDLQLTRVVSAVSCVGGTAGSGTGLAAHVRRAPRQL